MFVCISLGILISHFISQTGCVNPENKAVPKFGVLFFNLHSVLLLVDCVTFIFFFLVLQLILNMKMKKIKKKIKKENCKTALFFVCMTCLKFLNWYQ